MAKTITKEVYEMIPLDKYLGYEIRQQMQKHKRIPADIARASGYSPARVSQLMNQPTAEIETIEKVANAIGCDPRVFSDYNSQVLGKTYIEKGIKGAQKYLDKLNIALAVK